MLVKGLDRVNDLTCEDGVYVLLQFAAGPRGT